MDNRVKCRRIGLDSTAELRRPKNRLLLRASDVPDRVILDAPELAPAANDHVRNLDARIALYRERASRGEPVARRVDFEAARLEEFDW